MRRWMHKRGAGARARLGREEGSATLEFVILFPLLMTFFLSAIEIGIFTTRMVLLDHAVDMSVRDLRLGMLAPATSEELKRRVCDRALIVPDCMENIALELTPISTASWTFPDSSIGCVDRAQDIQPALDFNLGIQNELMIVRACVVVDPFFGSTPLVMDMPLDASGGYAIAAASTFVNEP